MNVKIINGKYECYFKELNLKYSVDNLENAVTIAFALGISKNILQGGK